MTTILDYVKSPLWKNPLLAFVDENCICFDDEDENKLEYTTIHNVKRELVISAIELQRLG